MTNLSFTTEKRMLKDLIPADWNPRKISPKQKKDLKDSLTRFGMAEIPVINLDGLIIAGHQRTKVLFEIHGNIELDVRVPNRLLTDDEVREYNIRSNKNTGEFDFEVLNQHFSAEELVEWGFDPSELTLEELEEVDEPKKQDSKDWPAFILRIDGVDEATIVKRLKKLYPQIDIHVIQEEELGFNGDQGN